MENCSLTLTNWPAVSVNDPVPVHDVDPVVTPVSVQLGPTFGKVPEVTFAAVPEIRETVAVVPLAPEYPPPMKAVALKLEAVHPSGTPSTNPAGIDPDVPTPVDAPTGRP